MVSLKDHKLDKILDNNKKNWQEFYSKANIFSLYPNLQILRLISPVKNKIKKVLDIGSGEGAQTISLKDKKIISLDYCKIKNKKIFQLDLRKESLNLNKLIMNSDLILLTQILDHITYENAHLITKDINSYYKSTKYILLSFHKSNCWGTRIKGASSYKGAYLTKIGSKTSITELHFFYTNNQVSKILKNFTRYKVTKKIVECSEEFVPKNKSLNFYVEIEYYLLEKK